MEFTIVVHPRRTEVRRGRLSGASPLYTCTADGIHVAYYVMRTRGATNARERASNQALYHARNEFRTVVWNRFERGKRRRKKRPNPKQRKLL